MTASQITLEASDPGQFVSIDSTLSAVKAKKGDEASIRISTKDAQENLVGNTPFALKHANSINRQNVTSSQKVSVTTAAGATVDTSATTILYGVTGPDGTTTMTLRQDASTGLRTDFYALLNDTGVSSDTLSVNPHRPPPARIRRWRPIGAIWRKPLPAAKASPSNGLSSKPNSLAVRRKRPIMKSGRCLTAT